MESETTIYESNGLFAVRIPKEYAKYFKLDKISKPRKCIIEDINGNEAKLTFQKW